MAVTRAQLLADPTSGARPLSRAEAAERARNAELAARWLPATSPPGRQGGAGPEPEREPESESTRRFRSEAITNALALTCQRARQTAHDGDFETARECLDMARGWGWDKDTGTVLPDAERYVEAAQAGEEWTRHLAPPPQKPRQEHESESARRSRSATIANARLWACRKAREAAHGGDLTTAREWLEKARGWDKGNGTVLPDTERYVEAAQAGEEWTADPEWIEWKSGHRAQPQVSRAEVLEDVRRAGWRIHQPRPQAEPEPEAV